MLRCERVSYRAQGEEILKDIDFALAKRHHLLILGPSGSGKTTLLNILSGLLTPDAGRVVYDDTDLYRLSPGQRDRFRGARLGLIFQTFRLIEGFSVKQNLLLAQTLAGKPVDEAHISRLMTRLGLATKADQRADRLSVGQAQRVAVARAVAVEPGWILCDEPTSALDDRNCQAMLELLLEEAERCRASLIMVTHDRRVQAGFDADHVLRLGTEVSS